MTNDSGERRRIFTLDASRHAAWDAFVTSHPDGTFFHLAGWRTVLSRAFGHAPHYLLAEEGGDITGVLPLALVDSRLFSRALISTPFCAYGGAVARDAATRRALEDAACARATELGVDYLELRNRTRSREDWPVKDLYVTFRREIAADDEANLKAIPRKQRAVVRKAIERGLESTVDTDDGDFYTMYSESLRNLGTPVFGRRYVRLLRECFGDACDIQTVRHEGRPIASVLNFYFRDEVLPYYGGGAREARKLGGNDFMYWEVMRRAAARGARVFDYGRSKQGTGAYSFKANWGFEATPLHYEYFLVRARSMPNLSPTNPRYELMIRMWQKLPLWATHIVGPPLARALG